MAAVLVTLTQAKAHLRITMPDGDPGDVDLQFKLDQAEAVILNYLKGANLHRAVLLNFGTTSLQYRRIVRGLPAERDPLHTRRSP